MVRPSLDSPTVYAAVDLETALDSALKKHESELREMERRKRDLEELAQQQRFRPSDEVSTFKIIKSLKEFLAIALPSISTLKEQWDMLIPESAVLVASQFGINPFTKELIDHGGRVRILITDLPYALIPLIRELIEMRSEVRCMGQEGLLFTVFDRRICVSAINVSVKRVTLDKPFTALWTDDPTYAQYLMSTFELLWKQSIPAEERIHELLKHGLPQTD